MDSKIKSREELVNEIAFALQQDFDEYDVYNYVDVTNNNVGLSINDITAVGELFPKDGDKIVRIWPLPSRESFGCMEDFADQVSDESQQESLHRALNRRHPFSNFRYAVNDAGLLQDWYHFRDEWYKEKAEEWMKRNGVDFKNGRITAKSPETYLREDDEDWDDDEDKDWDDDDKL